MLTKQVYFFFEICCVCAFEQLNRDILVSSLLLLVVMLNEIIKIIHYTTSYPFTNYVSKITVLPNASIKIEKYFSPYLFIFLCFYFFLNLMTLCFPLLYFKKIQQFIRRNKFILKDKICNKFGVWVFGVSHLIYSYNSSCYYHATASAHWLVIICWKPFVQYKLLK